MNVIIILLYIIAVVSAFLLIGVVLLQKGKDGGMVAMGSGVGTELFGAQVGTFLVKTTIVLGSVFLLSVLTISVINSRTEKSVGSIMGGASSSQLPASQD